MKEICRNFKSLNNVELERIQSRIKKDKISDNVYFKDFIDNGNRKFCFRAKPYDKDEVNEYTTNLTTIGFRKLGYRIVGVGKLK